MEAHAAHAGHASDEMDVKKVDVDHEEDSGAVTLEHGIHDTKHT